MTPLAFVTDVDSRLGQPSWVGTPRAVFKTSFEHRQLMMTGRFDFPALFGTNTTPIWINLDLSRFENGWQIDHIGWGYTPRSLMHGS